jgi:serine/threonine-protein kinase
MNADVAEAHERLRAAIALATQAGRELAEGLNAIALEESTEWERVGAALVPALSAADLGVTSSLVGDPQLPLVLTQRDQRRDALAATRKTLISGILSPTEFDAIAARRKIVDEKLAQARLRTRELRARPGVVEAVEAARRGQRVKEAVAAAVQEFGSLEESTKALEAENARLGALVARHHRLRKELAAIDDQLRSVDDDALREARTRAVEALARKADARTSIPRLAPNFHRLSGIEAKREVVSNLHERWVRTHGAELAELQRLGANVFGFETVTWPSRVRLRVDDATQAIDAFRRVCAAAVGFQRYDDVSGDWWSVLAPGVARADVRGDARGATPTVTVERVAHAEDKLAAAWASINDAGHGRPAGVPASSLLPTAPELSSFAPAWPAASETEVLAAPKPPRDDSAVFDRFFDQPMGPPKFATASPPSGGTMPAARGAPPPRLIDVDASFGSGAATATHTVSAAAAPFGAPRSASAAFAPGNRIGRIEIETMIGKGGMGEVYRARLEGDAGFRRVVVLKRLAIDPRTDPGGLRQFVAEAEVAARIAHPNVVQIFDVQSHDGEPFMVMEHLEGMSLLKLAAKARAAGIPIDRAVLTRCALDAARGLNAAHAMRGDDGNLAGLVHRDVSPDNLFLCSNGFTKLLDFGIASRNDLTSRTRANELKGKIPYMSPEQILGERIDGRSDLFSLGATLYYLLSGQRPFNADSDVSTLFAVVHKAHTPLLDVVADAGALGDIVERLLQKRPADRPSSALEVIDAFEHAGPATPESAAAFLATVWEA